MALLCLLHFSVRPTLSIVWTRILYGKLSMSTQCHSRTYACISFKAGRQLDKIADAVTNSSCKYVENNERFECFGFRVGLLICIFVSTCS